MTRTFVEAEHPRSKTVGKGKFVDRERSNPDAILTPADALNVAMSVTKGRKTSSGLQLADREDIAQEALLSVLTSTRNGVVAGMTGGLINTSVAFAASHFRDSASGVRHTDRKAWTTLQTEEDSAMQRLGREVTDSERAAMADRIRAKMPPGNRPSLGFENIHAFTVSVEEDVKSVVAAIPFEPPAPYCFDSDADLLVDIAEKRMTRVRARSKVWDAFEAMAGVPPVEQRLLSKADAAAVRERAEKEKFDAAAAAERYLDGDDMPGEEDLLFVAFPNSNITERCTVAETLTRHPIYADDLWDAALTAATKPR